MRLFDEFGERAVVLVDLDVLERRRRAATRRSATRSVTAITMSVFFLSAYSQRHGDRHVEDLAELLDVDRQLGAFDAVA